MKNLVTVMDANDHCYSIPSELKEAIDKHIYKGGLLAGDYDDLDKLIRCNILLRLKESNMDIAHERIYKLFEEFDKTSPIRHEKDVVYVVLNKLANFELYEKHPKIAQELAESLYGYLNIQHWPGSTQTPEYEKLYELTDKAGKWLERYISDAKHLITVLKGIRTSYEKTLELEDLKLQKARAEVNSIKNKDEALELILQNLDSLRKDLVEMKNNPQKDQTEVTKKVYALFESFTLFSGFNVDLSANGVKNEITLGKIGP